VVNYSSDIQQKQRHRAAYRSIDPQNLHKEKNSRHQGETKENQKKVNKRQKAKKKQLALIRSPLPRGTGIRGQHRDRLSRNGSEKKYNGRGEKED